MDRPFQGIAEKYCPAFEGTIVRDSVPVIGGRKLHSCRLCLPIERAIAEAVEATRQECSAHLHDWLGTRGQASLLKPVTDAEIASRMASAGEGKAHG